MLPQGGHINVEDKMLLREKFMNACVFTACVGLALGIAARPAFASDPLPGDDIPPPINVNIGLFYNQFNDAGSSAGVTGGAYSQNTHVSTDILVARYIRTFSLAGTEAGVQGFIPYVNFIGRQEAGISDISAPAAGLPDYGPGRANLSSSSGFGQPNISFFDFIINKPDTGLSLVLAPWLQLPIGDFNKNVDLTPAQDSWVYEMEAGLHLPLIGTPSVPNLALELWGEAYAFSGNNNSAYVTPEVSANNIPAIYTLVHNFINPLVPDSNPLAASSSTPASFHEQPSEEIHAYLSYEVAPSMGAFISPGFYQSFGGKQTYTLRNGEKVDSGNRTDETQLRLSVQTFVTPTTQITLMGQYDVAAQGGPLYRTIELRIVHFF
jgi:hypothetical protein